MPDKRRMQFLWSIAAVAFLLWAAAYGAYSGPKEFLFNVTVTDLLLVIFTGVLCYVAHRQHQHYTLTERAYLELSHTHPGLTFKDGKPGFQIKIVNKGRSPCRLVDFKMGFAFWRRRKPTDLPPPPHYDTRVEYNPSKGFLVPNGYIYVGGGIVGADVDYRAQVKAGVTLIAFCYVEYADIFGNLHHAGWGREYEPVNEGKDNNFGYLPSDDYNYDRPATQARSIVIEGGAAGAA